MQTKMDVGQSVAMFNHKKEVTLLCHKANKNKRVQLISTLHHRPSVIEKNRTDIQMFYNATKGGVDAFDQLCTKTSCSRTTNRWPLCLCFGIINLAYANSYILHVIQSKADKVQPLSRRDFGLKLGEELCRPWAVKRLQSANLPKQVRYFIGSVYNMPCECQPPPPPVEEAPRVRRRCYLCPSGKKARTKIVCVGCGRVTCPAHQKIYCRLCAP